MTEPLTLTTTINLAHAKRKETEAVNNTILKLTIIYYSETEERNRVDDDKHNPKLSCIYWTGTTEYDKTKFPTLSKCPTLN
jgi:hypothetical protein